MMHGRCWCCKRTVEDTVWWIVEPGKKYFNNNSIILYIINYNNFFLYKRLLITISWVYCQYVSYKLFAYLFKHEHRDNIDYPYDIFIFFIIVFNVLMVLSIFRLLRLKPKFDLYYVRLVDASFKRILIENINRRG